MYKGKGGYDQIDVLLKGLLENPSDRAHLVTSYIPQIDDEGVLNPCHVLQQYQYETIDGKTYLSMILYQRSTDLDLAAMKF